MKSVHRKTALMLNGGSDYGARPAIRDCVSHNMGESFTCLYIACLFVVTISCVCVLAEGEMESLKRKVSPVNFFARIARTASILCMPGLGYDTYRLSETLLLG